MSLAMDSEPDSATLYVASNDTVPLSLTTYLYKIQHQLKMLNAVLEFNSPTNNSQSDTVVASELELKKTIYEHESYSKLRGCFLNGTPTILAKYPLIKTHFRGKRIATEDTDLLDDTIPLLRWLGQRLEDQRPPSGIQGETLILVQCLLVDLRMQFKRAYDKGYYFKRPYSNQLFWASLSFCFFPLPPARTSTILSQTSCCSACWVA